MEIIRIDYNQFTNTFIAMDFQKHFLLQYATYFEFTTKVLSHL